MGRVILRMRAVLRTLVLLGTVSRLSIPVTAKRTRPFKSVISCGWPKISIIRRIAAIAIITRRATVPNMEGFTDGLPLSGSLTALVDGVLFQSATFQKVIFKGYALLVGICRLRQNFKGSFLWLGGICMQGLSLNRLKGGMKAAMEQMRILFRLYLRVM